MARSGTGIGYTPSQTSTSMPGSFDEEQMAVARKRALLQQLANQPAVESGYHGAHWVNPYRAQLGPALAQTFNALAQPEMDSELQDIAQRRGAAQDAWMANPPRLEDTPADPGNAGPSEGPGMMGPPAPMPGFEGEAVAGDQNQMGREYARALAAQQRGMGQDATINMETGAPTALADTQMQPLEAAPAAPMVPQAPQDFAPHRAATAMIPKSSLGEVLQWASKGAGFSPMAAKFGEHVAQQAFDAPAKKEAAAALVQAKKDTAAELAANRKHELTMKQMESASEKERERLFKVSMAEYKQQNDLEKMTQMYEFREALKAAGGAGGGKAQQSQYMDSTGTPLVFTNGVYTRAGDGLPPVGQLTSRAAAEKGAGEVRTADQAIARGKMALDYITNNPGAFGGKKAVAGRIAEFGGDAIEGAAKNKLYTPEEQEAQAFVGREGAQILKDLYGAALTTNEAGRATRFEYKQGDPPERIAAKIRGIMEIINSRSENQSGAAKAIARPAAPAGTRPPLSGY